jgi:hypothetical protein
MNCAAQKEKTKESADDWNEVIARHASVAVDRRVAKIRFSQVRLPIALSEQIGCQRRLFVGAKHLVARFAVQIIDALRGSALLLPQAKIRHNKQTR